MSNRQIYPQPTHDPTHRSSPRPTGFPTPRPTVKPTRVCDLDVEQSINIVFSNGCNIWDDHECDDVKTFLTNIVERSFNPNYIDSMKFLRMI